MEKYQEVAEFFEEITRCGRCGFCQSVCPVYGVSADERAVARGRNMYARELLAGTVEHTRGNDLFFSECLLCRACVETCFSGVKTDEIVLAGRRSRRRIYGMSSLHRYIFEQLLPDYRKFGGVIRLLKAVRWAGSPQLGPALRLFGWLGASVARAEQMSRRIPDESFRERFIRRGASLKSPKRAMLFVGCGTNFMFPHVGEATVIVLEALGYDTVVVEHACCGLPAFACGELEAAAHLARNNVHAFADESTCIIISDCSSCASFLKDYPRLLSLAGDEQTGIEEAERFSARVKDIVELLAVEGVARIHRAKKTDSMKRRRTVSFHDPCHLGRYQNKSHMVRDILSALPEIDFIEMKQADWCCGGAGAFAIEHPDLSRRILEEKIRNVKSSGADTVLTTCPSCVMQIRAGIEDACLDVHVAHLVEIIGEGLPESQQNLMNDVRDED